MKQKIIIKLQMDCDKCRNKALKTAAEVKGVTTVSLEGDENVAVTGTNVDTVCLANQLKKKFRCVNILTVEDLDKKKKEEDEKKKKEEEEKKKREACCAALYLPSCEGSCTKCHSSNCHGKCNSCSKCRSSKCDGKCATICFKCHSTKCHGQCCKPCSKCESSKCDGHCVIICFKCQSPKCNGQCKPCYKCHNSKCPGQCPCHNCHSNKCQGCTPYNKPPPYCYVPYPPPCNPCPPYQVVYEPYGDSCSIM